MKYFNQVELEKIATKVIVRMAISGQTSLNTLEMVLWHLADEMYEATNHSNLESSKFYHRMSDLYWITLRQAQELGVHA